jgi:hypothetical protein
LIGGVVALAGRWVLTGYAVVEFVLSPYVGADKAQELAAGATAV